MSNMGLEVHAVKCAKAHTLILTNNGVSISNLCSWRQWIFDTMIFVHLQLYSMGSNLMGQLGIGKHHVQALQPMLVHEFDGKNISLIEVGQYHNAVYADGELYTWGWGVYGQLGHGNIFTEDRPKIVRFFGNKVMDYKEMSKKENGVNHISLTPFVCIADHQTNGSGPCAHTGVVR